MSLVGILACAVSFLACLVVALWAFKKDDARETLHKHFIELAQILREYGLKHIPEILVDLAVGDISGAVEQVKFFVKLVKLDPKKVVEAFDTVFDRVLEKKLTDPASLALLKAKIAEAEAKLVG